jgi:hypothetical protein
MPRPDSIAVAFVAVDPNRSYPTLVLSAVRLAIARVALLLAACPNVCAPTSHDALLPRPVLPCPVHRPPPPAIANARPATAALSAATSRPHVQRRLACEYIDLRRREPGAHCTVASRSSSTRVAAMPMTLITRCTTSALAETIC